ncbi:hypothetical protein [Thermomonospora cellulosilytica]|uniref:Uncharacterized protein n=1 Tax=Thermomonospora cellulosilytica TaxID=1411118 RepID=A0A7W3MTR3_9ACTN|nr:hypothetical protein [Thermomonospora cellulosilytica]MBA9001745.1 hypothetical protein [Thermomonospora cellulosilytica]
MVKSSEPLDRSYGVGSRPHGVGPGGAGGDPSGGLKGLKRFAVMMVAIMVLAPLGTALYMHFFLGDAEDEKPAAPPVRKSAPFTAETFFGTGTRFKTPGLDYDRTAAAVADGASGCQAGAVGAQARALLQRLGCRGRVEGAFVTVDRKFPVTAHVLRFDDEAAARRAAATLKAEQMRFLQDGRTSGGRRHGDVRPENRFVVVTIAQAPKGAVRAAAEHLNAEVNAVIIWTY